MTNFGRALFNSLYTSLIATIGAILVSIPAAYALSRFRFRGRGAFNQFLLISQMLSPIVLVVGLFRLIAALGLVDNVPTVGVIYMAFNIAFTVWMLQSYFAASRRTSRRRHGWKAPRGRRRWSRCSCPW